MSAVKIIHKAIPHNINNQVLLENLTKEYGKPLIVSGKNKAAFKRNSQDENTIYLQLPLYEAFEDEKIIDAQLQNYIIVIVHSGEASLALCDEEGVLEHKNLKTYMVRKKQGKSQIKHLKTKGKSKAGSRVRLANTEHFFDQITTLLNEWMEFYPIDRFAVSCPKTLYPFFFSEKLEINRDDSKIFKIPIHIEEANYTNLLCTKSHLLRCHLSYPQYESDAISLLINDCIEHLDD